MAGSPAFLGNPVVLLPCSTTPAGRSRVRSYDAAARPPCCPRRRLPHLVFRGSITRPWHSLSTLRRGSRLAPTQDSLPAADQLYRTGSTRRVPSKGFRVCVTSSSSFPKHRSARAATYFAKRFAHILGLTPSPSRQSGLSDHLTARL